MNIDKLNTTLTSYEEVDKQLYELAKIEADLSIYEADKNKELNKVERYYEKLTKAKIEKKNSIVQEIELFALAHKKDFTAKGKTRTKKLKYGMLSFRMSPGAVTLIRKIKDGFKKAAQDLKEMYQNKYIRVVPELNKEALLKDYNEGKLDDISLASVNLRIEKEDKFSLSINWKQLEKEGIKAIDLKKK